MLSLARKVSVNAHIKDASVEAYFPSYTSKGTHLDNAKLPETICCMSFCTSLHRLLWLCLHVYLLQYSWFYFVACISSRSLNCLDDNLVVLID